jgi:ribose 5-phosphate isomerase A
MDVCEIHGEPDGHAAKAAAAAVALRYIEAGTVIGVGSGTTANEFIEALRDWTGPRPMAAVASSLDTAHLLRAAGIEVSPLPPSGRLPLYVDGADQVDPALRMLKGHGGAHTREKILASAADMFVCIVDDSKVFPALGGHTVPVEYVPMSRAFVARQIAALGGDAVERPGFVTDNGNGILDVTGLDLSDASLMEITLEAVPGIVCCGIFARRPADVLLVGHADGSADTRWPA